MARETLISPLGDLMWAQVLKPGIQNRGKPSEKEVWSVDLLLPKSDPEAQAFVTSIKKLFVHEFGTAARPGQNGMPFKTYLDDQGNETDLWKIAFSRNTVTKRGTELSPPAVQDAKGNPWPKDLLIGNGSTGKVAFTYFPWDNPEGGKGVSLQLEAVRVITLQEYAPPSPADAFGEPEEGFTLPAAATEDDDWGTPSDEEAPF